MKPPNLLYDPVDGGGHAKSSLQQLREALLAEDLHTVFEGQLKDGRLLVAAQAHANVWLWLFEDNGQQPPQPTRAYDAQFFRESGSFRFRSDIGTLRRQDGSRGLQATFSEPGAEESLVRALEN